MGYAFVDLKSADEAQKAIENLSGKDVLERKVSVQLARKPEPAGEKTEGVAGEGGDLRKRSSGRGRGRGRGRGGRGAPRIGRTVCLSTSHFHTRFFAFFRSTRHLTSLALVIVALTYRSPG